ncbi:MAG: C39 family peptidase [Candidatus Saccharibacteria bacterium]|jgi:hypothetical protein|nr:C39 family peptidase [Candidatus Saccharibacteria bacterium]
MRLNIKTCSIALFAMLAVSAFMVSGNASAKTYYFGHKKVDSYNYRQDKTWLSGWNSGKYGCGPVSIATAASYLYGQKITPATVGAAAKKMGYNLNSGFSGSAFKNLASKGLAVKTLSKNANTIASHVKDGWIVALHAHGGQPFNGGHWVVVYGGQIKVNSKGNITAKEFCISDPGHSKYRGKCGSASALLKNMKSNIDVVAMKRK